MLDFTCMVLSVHSHVFICDVRYFVTFVFLAQTGLLYNLTADVDHLKGFPSRFYFTGNGTSNTTAGRVNTKPDDLTCVPHQAFMRVSTKPENLTCVPHLAFMRVNTNPENLTCVPHLAFMRVNTNPENLTCVPHRAFMRVSTHSLCCLSWERCLASAGDTTCSHGNAGHTAWLSWTVSRHSPMYLSIRHKFIQSNPVSPKKQKKEGLCALERTYNLLEK